MRLSSVKIYGYIEFKRRIIYFQKRKKKQSFCVYTTFKLKSVDCHNQADLKNLYYVASIGIESETVFKKKTLWQIKYLKLILGRTKMLAIVK